MTTEVTRFFFSYAREDSDFVLKLARELRMSGANLWLDRLDIRGGQRWDEAVQAAVESCQGMVAILSPSAVASQNVMDEISYALEEKKQVIPVLYQKCAIPFRLRRVQYVDFSPGYEEAFAELLRALGLEQPTEKAVPPRTEERGPEEAVQSAIHEDGRRDGLAAAEQTAFEATVPIGALVGAISGSVIAAVLGWESVSLTVLVSTFIGATVGFLLKKLIRR